jgi:hypothetical protein
VFDWRIRLEIAFAALLKRLPVSVSPTLSLGSHTRPTPPTSIVLLLGQELKSLALAKTKFRVFALKAVEQGALYHTTAGMQNNLFLTTLPLNSIN